MVRTALLGDHKQCAYRNHMCPTCPALASSSLGCCCAAAASGAVLAVAVSPRDPQPAQQHQAQPTTQAPSACNTRATITQAPATSARLIAKACERQQCVQPWIDLWRRRHAQVVQQQGPAMPCVAFARTCWCSAVALRLSCR
jgi:hypothetical protein